MAWKEGKRQMELSDVWKSVTHIRDEDEAIIAVQVPIELWRFLIDRVQQMEDREAARQNLARLRQSQETKQVEDE
jgi:hypothetical protein